ncbi:MAG: hypothetical protein AAGF97_14460, partial [Planctomycetota bacterium]
MLISRWMRLLLAAWLLASSGCGGCRPGETDAEKRAEALRKQQEEDQKPDFEPPLISVLPATVPAMAQVTDDEEEDAEAELPEEEDLESLVRTLVIKPGHWMEVWHQLKSNKRDFSGRLSVAMSDRQREPWRLERTPF